MKALVIARFQPLHRGHEHAVNFALSRFDEVIIGVGSSNEAFTFSNPLSFEERKKMIEILFPGLEVVPIPDFHDDEAWSKYVLDIGADVVISSSEWVKACLENKLEVIAPPEIERAKLNGTRIRARAVLGLSWEELVPEKVAEFLKEINFEGRLKGIWSSKPFLETSDLTLYNKLVALRADLNSPVKDGKIMENPRLRAHAKTIKTLSKLGAKLIVLAHQGRKGKKDFLGLEQHAELLSRLIGKEVKFVDDLTGIRAKLAIENLKPGDVLLLDNVRFLDDETEKKSIEEHEKSRLVKFLSNFVDVFVLDAFSVAHRSHASVVGFAKLKPSLAGPVFLDEYRNLSKLRKPERPFVAIFGGAKPEECFDMMESMFKNRILDLALTTGVIAEIFLLAIGKDLGEETTRFLEEKGFTEHVERARELLSLGRIEVPVDLAFEENGARVEAEVEKVKGLAKDIGSRTIEKYRQVMKDARTLLIKGPAGVYEEELFRKGTYELLRAAKESKAFVVIAGGDSSKALELLGFKTSDFGYVSLSGGAAVEFLSGRELPGIKALALSKEIWIRRWAK